MNKTKKYLKEQVKVFDLKFVLFVILAVVFFILTHPYRHHGSEIARFDTVIVYLNYVFAFANISVLGFLLFRLISKHRKKLKFNYHLIVLLLISIFFIFSFLRLPLYSSVDKDSGFYEYPVQAAFIDRFNLHEGFVNFYGNHGFVNGVFIKFVNIFIGDYLLSAKITSIIFYSLSIFALFYLALLITGNSLVSYFSVFAFAFNFYTYRMGFNTSMEFSQVFLSILFFLFFFLYEFRKIDGAQYIFILLMPLLIQLRYSNGILILPLIIYYLWNRKIFIFLKENAGVIILAGILLTPFLIFMHFGFDSLIVNMSHYSQDNYAESIGWYWWDGPFSIKYFINVFPQTVQTLFFKNLYTGLISYFSIYCFIFLFTKKEREKKVILFTWFISHLVIFSSHFMNMPGHIVYERYFLHFLLPFILLLNLFIYEIIHWGKKMTVLLSGKLNIKIDKKSVYRFFSASVLVIIYLLFIFNFLQIKKPLYDAELTGRIGDPDYIYFTENIENIIPKECIIISEDIPGSNMDFIAYLSGYPFYWKEGNGFRNTFYTIDSLPDTGRCRKYLCVEESDYIISEIPCP